MRRKSLRCSSRKYAHKFFVHVNEFWHSVLRSLPLKRRHTGRHSKVRKERCVKSRKEINRSWYSNSVQLSLVVAPGATQGGGAREKGGSGAMGRWGEQRCANVINIIFITQKYADERRRTAASWKPSEEPSANPRSPKWDVERVRERERRREWGARGPLLSLLRSLTNGREWGGRRGSDVVRGTKVCPKYECNWAPVTWLNKKKRKKKTATEATHRGTMGRLCPRDLPLTLITPLLHAPQGVLPSPAYPLTPP